MLEHARQFVAATLIVFSLSFADRAGAAPATDHPRLWLNSSDLGHLTTWASATNPMYAQGLMVAANTAKAHADANWNWATGQPGAGWHDTGGTNWESDATEAYAEFFAFMSLVDPNVAQRPQWAMRARALLMWVMNQAVQGPAANVAFRDPGFITGNRANYWGEAWGLTVDWIIRRCRRPTRRPSAACSCSGRTRSIWCRTAAAAGRCCPARSTIPACSATIRARRRSCNRPTSCSCAGLPTTISSARCARSP